MINYYYHSTLITFGSVNGVAPPIISKSLYLRDIILLGAHFTSCNYYNKL